MVDDVVLSSEPDMVRWNIGTTGKFIVRSLYLQLRATATVHYKGIWDIKNPLKVKNFIWLMVKNSVLTKDNLLRRGWHGSAQCLFCCRDETVDHLLFTCPLAKFAWQVVMFAYQLVMPPESTTDFLGNWLASFPVDQHKLVLCGGPAVVWTIWEVRNAACFRTGS